MTTQELQEAVGENWHQVQNFIAQEVSAAIAAAVATATEPLQSKIDSAQGEQDALEVIAKTEKDTLTESAKAVQLELTAAKAALTALTAKVAATTAAVKGAYEKNDIPAMLAIAADFVTPEQEKERVAGLAKATALEAQAAELRTKFTQP